MQREFLITAEGGEVRVACREDGRLVEYYEEGDEEERLAGNVYKGRVETVLPGMDAAFVDVGLDRNAYLYLPDVLRATEPAGRAGVSPGDGKGLRPGQEVVVQVVKEPVGEKGARVSPRVTLPGRFVVLIPSAANVAVSQRIPSEEERERLRELAAAVRPEGFGVIVRTAAAGHGEADLRRDLEALLATWWEIVERAPRAKAPALLYREQGLVARVLREGLGPEVVGITVDDRGLREEVRRLVRLYAPELEGRVHLYREGADGRRPLFVARGVEEELERALARRVWLPSGAYVVVDQGEALTAFDVNTGRFTGSTGLADTVFAVNREAAAEVARQLRLRDIGGIAVVDFIDMADPARRSAVLRELEDHVRRDRAPVTVHGYTRLGLVELVRRKKRRSLTERWTVTCPTCQGAGRVAAPERAARRLRIRLLRLLRETVAGAVVVEVHPEVARLLEGTGAGLAELERLTGKSVAVRASPARSVDELHVVALGGRRGAKGS